MSLHRSLDKITDLDDDILRELKRISEDSGRLFRDKWPNIISLQFPRICECILNYLQKLSRSNMVRTTQDNIILHNMKNILKGSMKIYLYQCNENVLKLSKNAIALKEKRVQELSREEAEFIDKLPSKFLLLEKRKKRPRALTVPLHFDEARDVNDIWYEIENIHFGSDLHKIEEDFIISEQAAGPFNKIEEQFDDDVNALAKFYQRKIDTVRASVSGRESHAFQPEITGFPEDHHRTILPGLTHEGAHDLTMHLPIDITLPQVPVVQQGEEPRSTEHSRPATVLTDYINEIMESTRRTMKPVKEKHAKKNIFRSKTVFSPGTMFKQFKNRVIRMPSAIPPSEIFNRIMKEEIELLYEYPLQIQAPLKQRRRYSVEPVDIVYDEPVVLKRLPDVVRSVIRDQTELRRVEVIPEVIRIEESVPIVEPTQRYSVMVAEFEDVIMDTVAEQTMLPVSPALPRTEQISPRLLQVPVTARELPNIVPPVVLSQPESVQEASLENLIAREQFRHISPVVYSAFLTESLEAVTETLTVTLESTLSEKELQDDLLSTLSVLWAIKEVNFTDLCPKYTTTRNVVAKTFRILLSLWGANRILIQQEQGQTDPDSIKIISVTLE